MSQNFSITTTVASSGDPDTAGSLINNLERLKKTIFRLQEVNTDLERLKDESLMCIQQYSDDIEMLKMVQKRLKSMTSRSYTKIQQNDQNSSIAQSQQMIPPPQIQQSIQKPVNAIPSISDHLIQSSTPLSMTEINWSCDPPEYKDSAITLKYCISSPKVLCTVEFSADGKLFAFADGNDIFIMNTADGSLVGTAPIPVDESAKNGEQHTRILTFSPDRKYIAIGGHNHDVVVYQVDNPKGEKYTLKGHTNYVSSLAFSADSKVLYSGGFDGMICMWNMETFQLIKKRVPSQSAPDETAVVVGLALAHDQIFLAVGYMNGTVGIFNPTLDDTEPRIFSVHNNSSKSNLLGLALSYDDSALATAAQDTTSTLWSMKGVNPKRTQVFQGHGDLVITVCFSPNGHIVFSGSKDEKLKAWNTKTGECIFTISAHANTLFRVHHHPTENCFVSCAGDGKVCVWEYNPVWENQTH